MRFGDRRLVVSECALPSVELRTELDSLTSDMLDLAAEHIYLYTSVRNTKHPGTSERY